MASHASNGVDVAVVGATGAVGQAMLNILEERNFPVNNIYPLASERSAGGQDPGRDREHRPMRSLQTTFWG